MPRITPSLRQKKRYVFFRVHSDGPVRYSDIRNAAWNALLDWLGEKELARARVSFLKNLWNSGNQTGVLRCSHTAVDQVKVGLALVHQIGDRKVVFQTLRVSGTIKSGKRKS